MRFLFITITCLTVNLLHSQDYVELRESTLLDKVYSETIRTVVLRPVRNPLELPIIKLNSIDRLMLEFDDLGPEFTNFQYTLLHCTHDWKPSAIFKQEYLEGLQEHFISEHEFSMNTWVPYTHYRLTIPNNNIRLTKSGNYVLLVYQNDNPNDLILTRRFMVYEEIVNVAGNVIRAVQLEEMNTHQQLNFTISHPGYEIPDPFVDLHVNVMQNGRWDNALLDIKPKFLRNGQLDYNFEGENSFPGGNEFRNFDTKQLTELTMNIRKTRLEEIWNVFLVPEIPRNAQRYSFWQDANGRFVVRRLNSARPQSEADYAWVDFFLTTDEYLGKEVYVFGQLSDWQVKKDFKLTYDANVRSYRGQILLKQGYFDYQYVLYDPISRQVDESAIEGSFWETSNEYSIFVYHRELGIRYDRLVGYQMLLDASGRR